MKRFALSPVNWVVPPTTFSQLPQEDPAEHMPIYLADQPLLSDAREAHTLSPVPDNREPSARKRAASDPGPSNSQLVEEDDHPTKSNRVRFALTVEVAYCSGSSSVRREGLVVEYLVNSSRQDHSSSDSDCVSFSEPSGSDSNRSGTRRVTRASTASLSSGATTRPVSARCTTVRRPAPSSRTRRSTGSAKKSKTKRRRRDYCDTDMG
ncbi:hypothetical protein NMY22_g9014 [Coprinellus aureogranulatus]|nr:hypothetical protein NMY22_g9014 [Coprinellus aureogranulatus]